MELLIVLSVFVLIGLSGALAGADSRDGADWHSRDGSDRRSRELSDRHSRWA